MNEIYIKWIIYILGIVAACFGIVASIYKIREAKTKIKESKKSDTMTEAVSQKDLLKLKKKEMKLQKKLDKQ